MNDWLGRNDALRCAITGTNRSDCRNINAGDAREIESVLSRYAAALMMGVYAAHTAKVVLSLHGVPLVKRELVCALGDAKSIERDGSHNGTFAAANGTVATADVFEAISEVDLELDRAAMTSANLCDHQDFHLRPNA